MCVCAYVGLGGVGDVQNECKFMYIYNSYTAGRS